MTFSKRYVLIKAHRGILSPFHEISPVSIFIDRSTGKIVNMLDKVECNMGMISSDEIEIIQLEEDQLVMPGLIDAHVHLNEPGRTEWEGFETGTKAAAAGGVTTVIDMPLNAIPPTTTVNNLKLKLAAAKDQCHVDVAYWGGIIPDNLEDIPLLMKEGVCGFKCFLIESGVDEFPCVNELEVRAAMEKIANSNKVLLFHAEMEVENNTPQKYTDSRSYSTFLHSRPQALETKAIDMIIRLANEFHTQGKHVRTHIVHLSAASALPAIREAKSRGIPLTVETCFHYLQFNSEDIEDGATHYKCCPPIRESSNRELLWDALLDGTIDYVVSDHSPCTAQLKKQETGDFLQAWGGIASVQFGLPVLWTEGRKRGISIQQLVHWLSYSPAKNTKLDNRKGEIKVGHDADIVIWSPDTPFTVNESDIHFKNKLSPYIGHTFYGRVDHTLLRGHTVYERKQPALFDSSPKGCSLMNDS
ncbi:allantoinase [Pilobolus umbonatus]|nr:allantoinase [Pilobolus umbonatus]